MTALIGVVIARDSARGKTDFLLFEETIELYGCIAVRY